MPEHTVQETVSNRRRLTATGCLSALLAAPVALFRSRDGGTAIEYALLAAVVAITGFAALRLLGGESGGMWEKTGKTLVDGMKHVTTQ